MRQCVGRGNQAANKGSYSENSAFHMLQGGGAITFQNGKVHVTNVYGLFIQGNSKNTAYL
ncbi:hypothetical protein [Bartonella vinsonii]|uniref:hypothetical protein n=1 Tax=Bartonella vinsonii TaxID=33047 RepID=UPI000F84048B|nr:hypothetical protein [Bartonella vinsonii]